MENHRAENTLAQTTQVTGVLQATTGRDPREARLSVVFFEVSDALADVGARRNVRRWAAWAALCARHEVSYAETGTQARHPAVFQAELLVRPWVRPVACKMASPEGLHTQRQQVGTLHPLKSATNVYSALVRLGPRQQGGIHSEGVLCSIC